MANFIRFIDSDNIAHMVNVDQITHAVSSGQGAGVELWLSDGKVLTLPGPVGFEILRAMNGLPSPIQEIFDLFSKNSDVESN